ncbi:SRPBCC family protein [Ruania albidiflava]|uniref:SRPBCC family protein n=1 Tax=Ruania albidiflava TaxID=366586 RepID=UPI0004099295|nr:SRPBCC family protein [Ruania albidiflava]
MTSSWASRVIDADAERVFAAITTLELHRDLIPLTRVQAPAPPLRRGDRVVATSLGVLRDTMLVTRTEPPQDGRRGVVVFDKTGPVLLGRARIAVTALGSRTCRVDWTEDVHLVAPWHLAQPVVDRILAVMTRRALRRFDLQLRRHAS